MLQSNDTTAVTPVTREAPLLVMKPEGSNDTIQTFSFCLHVLVSGCEFCLDDNSLSHVKRRLFDIIFLFSPRSLDLQISWQEMWVHGLRSQWKKASLHVFP